MTPHSSHKQQSVSLVLPARQSFLPLVQGCVEKGARLMGLDNRGLMGLSLAVEEIFLHLCRVSASGEQITLALFPVPTGVELRFTVKAGTLRLSGLNVVTSDKIRSLLAGEDFNQIGLLLAAGFIDHFSLRMTPAGNCVIQLRQERFYPRVTPGEPTTHPPAAPPLHLVVAPSPEILQQAGLLVNSFYPAYLFAPLFRQPGKFADLVQGGELGALVLEDAIGSVCGLISWETESTRAVRFHGPYVFSSRDEQDIARLLVEAFIGQMARTPAKIVFTTQATDQLPGEQFEKLGTLDYRDADNRSVELTSCYRHMREDHGMAVWCHPVLRDFLDREYNRLVLQRDIRLTADHGANRDDTSVFGLRLDRESSLAIITPLLDGRDINENLALHVTHLAERNIRNILCITDLGTGWQAAMAEPLLGQGFTPRLVQPLAGPGDRVVFQYAAVQP